MIVTTKTGQGGKPKINLRVEGRMSMPTQIPELADGVQYMRMFNEAIEARTPGAEPKFSEEAIQGTIDKLDPYVYPNVNWYKELFKRQTYTQAVNLNVSGGIAKRVTYFMSASITNESGRRTPSRTTSTTCAIRSSRTSAASSPKPPRWE